MTQTLPLGAKLPAERDLAESYNCNFLTVRKALKQLVNDGTIVRRIGSGTFIARHHNNGSPLNSGARCVGILVYQSSNDYAYRVLQAVAHIGLKENVDLRSSWVQDFGEDSLSQAEQLKKDGCVALMLPWFPHEMVEEVRTFVQQCPLPVSIAMLIPGLERNCFVDPGIFGLSTVVEDLCSYYRALGHQRIAFLGPDSHNDVILQKKLTSYACYVSRENIPNLCGLVASGAQAVDQIAERWKQHQGDLAIISYDDEHALRFMTAMHKIGLSAPEDYCIVGFNDTEASRYSDPPLSTVHQNFDYLGYWLLKSALALSNDQVDQAARIPRLQMLVRGTCGGAGRLNDSFHSQFAGMDVVQENEGLPQELPSSATAAPLGNRFPTGPANNHSIKH